MAKDSKNKKENYQGLTKGELFNSLEKKRAEWRGYRIGGLGGKQKNVHVPRLAKKEIARILTAISQKSA